MSKIGTGGQGVSVGRVERGTTPRLPVIITALAFLIFFVAWIPLYLWLQSQLGTPDVPGGGADLALGLLAAIFWLVVFGLTVFAIRWSRGVFDAWTTADLMLVAVLGAVFGVIFWAWALVYNALSPALAGWSGLVNGMWYVPAILAPYIIRKPGAALVAETLAGVLAVLLGSPWGVIGSAIAGLTQGIGAEVVFALTGWRRYDWLTLTLAGLGAAVAGFVFVYPIWNIGLSTELLIINFVSNVISVIIFAVIGGKLLGDALLATGVLNRFAIGRERRQAQVSSDF